MAADGSAEQPDDDLRRAALRRPDPLSRDSRGSSSSASSSSTGSGSARCKRSGAAYWETVPRVDIAEHVERISLPGRAGKRELQALVSRLASHAARSASGRCGSSISSKISTGGSALILRIHHCYADGIALVRVLMSMTDAASEGPPAMPFEPAPRAARRRRRRSAAAAVEAALRRDEARADGGIDADREGRGDLVRPGAGGRARRAGRRADRRDREARADAAGFADAIQGHAGRGQSASRGPSRSRSTK